MEQEIYSRRIAELDDDDKPREKAINHGIDHLTNTELLAILLGSGAQGLSAIDLSREILKANEYKLSRMAKMSINELCSKYKGVGPAKAITVLAAIELGARCVHSLALETVTPRIKASNDIYALMANKLERKDYEEFWVIFLNNSNMVQSFECVSQGGLASTVVDVKIILKKAIDKLSTSIILVHNHPSGNLKPSIQDDNITQKIKESVKYVDMRLLDHIIIAPQGYYSYADEGRL